MKFPTIAIGVLIATATMPFMHGCASRVVVSFALNLMWSTSMGYLPVFILAIVSAVYFRNQLSKLFGS